MSGWLKLHRKLKESDVYKNSSSSHKAVVLSILLNVNYETSTWWDRSQKKNIDVPPGSWATSLRKVAEEAEVSVKAVRNALTRLEAQEFIQVETHPTYTLITLCRWSYYQHSEPKGTERGTPETRTGANDRTQDVTRDVPHIKEVKKLRRKKGKEARAESDLPNNDISDDLQQKAMSVYGHVPPVLCQWVDHYPPPWIPMAIDRTADRGKAKPSYTKAILEDWRKQGGPDGSTSENSKSKGRQEYEEMKRKWGLA